MTIRYDYDFDVEAPNNTAAAIFRYAREHGPRVLDIGSGPGVVSSKLARDLDFEVTALDYDPDSIAVAKDRGVQRAFVADLTAADWFEPVRGESFDLIVLADVLEHLPRPQDVLNRIRELGLLAPGGRIVVSIPNASHEMVIASLLVDDFRYTDVGVLDETHIRWFTWKSMQRLLQSEGYTIERSTAITRTLDQTSHKSVRIDLDPELRKAILRQAPHAGIYQYVFVVAPLEGSAAALVGRDDEVVREASLLADDFIAEYKTHRAHLEAEMQRRDQQISELTALVHESREHAKRELDRAVRDQQKLSKELDAAAVKYDKSTKTIAEQKRDLASARPYLRGRRLAGRVKRRLRRTLR